MEFFIFTNLLIILPCALFWFVLSRMNWKIWGNFKQNERAWGLYAKSGIIGVPIHELSHALFCIIFGHTIVDMQLYNSDAYYDDEEDTLGYVDYEYNPNSLYQAFGQFFVGIAPLLIGSLLIVVLLRFIMPGTFGMLAQINITDLSFISMIKEIFTSAYTNIQVIFGNHDSIWQLLLFFIISFSISTQMHCSRDDLAGALPGFILVETLLLAIGIFMMIYKVGINLLLLVNISAYMITIIFLELLLSAIFLLISFALKN